MPTTDMRAIFKTVLYQHMRVNSQALDTTIFPNADGVQMIPGLLAS